MRQLIYVSAARFPFTQPQLAELLRRSRSKNRTLDISGLLLYHAESFLQVLEGPEAAVRGLAKTIAADPWHDRFKTVFDRAIAVRSFAGWAMGYADPSAADFVPTAGRLDFLTELNAADGLKADNRARWVVDLFRAGRMRQADADPTRESPALVIASGGRRPA